MALTSIELVLAEVSDLFDSLVTDSDIVANLDHPPLASELEGRSPIVSTHWNGGIHQFHGNDYTDFDGSWIVTIFINREGHTNTNAETLLAQIASKIMQKVRDNVNGTNYTQLAPFKDMNPYFTTINGVPYRICEIYLVSRTTDN